MRKVSKSRTDEQRTYNRNMMRLNRKMGMGKKELKIHRAKLSEQATQENVTLMKYEAIINEPVNQGLQYVEYVAKSQPKKKEQRKELLKRLREERKERIKKLGRIDIPDMNFRF